jgi:hypothetical protein
MSAIKHWTRHLALYSRGLEVIFDEIGLLGHELTAKEAEDLAAEAATVRLRASAVFRSLDGIAKGLGRDVGIHALVTRQLFEKLKERAEKENRSLSSMAAMILEGALKSD